MKTTLTTLALLAATHLSLAGAAEPPKPEPVKLGAYYFGGWRPGNTRVTDRLKTEFAQREPVWGWLDTDLANMQQQINFAADAGLKFWAFCWYCPENGEPTNLNEALDLYLAAPNHARLQYCLMVANHAPYRIGPKHWPAISAQWIELFKKPTYLTVDGKPLLIIFSPGEIIRSFGTTDAVKAAFDQLRADAKAAGLPGVTIAACTLPGPENGWDDLYYSRICGYDVYTGYNYHTAIQMDPAGKKQAYDSLIPGHEFVWNRFAEIGRLPYIPCVTSGWDKRPWEKLDLPASQQDIYFPDRSPAKVETFVGKAMDWVQAHPDKVTKEKLILLYAWNEYAEGGALAPTKSQGTAYLDAITQALKARQQFSPQPAPKK